MSDTSENSTPAQRAISAMKELVESFNERSAEMDTESDLQKKLVFFFQMKEVYTVIDEQRKLLYKTQDRWDKVVVPAAIEASGFDKVQVPEIARSFYVLDKYSASVLDKGQGYEWLRDNGASELITETVNAGTLASFFRDYIIQVGKEPPEEIFKFSKYNTTGMARYTPKEKK